MKAFIIEDDILWQTKLEMIADELGVAVIGKSENVFKSREFLLAQTPDFIISDIMLGDEKVFDLFADGKFTDIPVLFLTQSVNPENYNHAKHLKHSHFLVKPFHALSLQAAIDILMKPFTGKIAEHQNAIEVKGRHNEKIMLPASEIICVTQNRNYSFIKTACQQFALKTSLTSIQKELGENFIQVNRGCIVNKYFIKQVAPDNNHVKVYGELITIGRKFKADVSKYIAGKTKL